MLRYVKLKNFMSFKDVTFDFRKGNKGVKQLISIYGENGSGKTNFVNSIKLLRQSIDSFYMGESAEMFSEIIQDKDVPKEILQAILDMTNISYVLDNCRMIESDENTSIEYGFKIGNHEGYYIISFADKFTYEKLYYFTGKQSGTLFEITFENQKINTIFSGKLFSNKKLKAELSDEVEKYWGKHTFLSILSRERNEKNEQYVKANYLSYLFDFIDMLEQTTIHCKRDSRLDNELKPKRSGSLLESLKEGKVKVENSYILDRSERILNDFFTQAYADIKQVYYETKNNGGHISYKLFVKKMIGEKIRTVDFSKESAGTQHILEIIKVLLGAFCGDMVIYDEIDNGIHDLLLKNIIESMIDDITGQLIITTHNTYLLETIDIKSVYVITVDYMGNKEVRCLDKYPIQASNNTRIMYLKGMFGGIPFVDMIDYDEIIQELGSDLVTFESKGGDE